MAFYGHRIDLPGTKKAGPAAPTPAPPPPAAASMPVPFVPPSPPPPPKVDQPALPPSLQALEIMSGPQAPPGPGEGWGTELSAQLNVPGGRMLPAAGRALLELTRSRGGRAY